MAKFVTPPTQKIYLWFLRNLQTFGIDEPRGKCVQLAELYNIAIEIFAIACMSAEIE